jgi:iron complex outermembrane receptor protein
MDFGLLYEVHSVGIGSAAFGLLKDDYRRTVDVPTFTPTTFHTTPWLINTRFAVESGRSLIVYGSFTQGLEDSALAPVTAVNRGEPPAAARSWQVDGGVRYTPTEKLRLILGTFNIHKPYLNLDNFEVYRPIGRQESKGLESSLSYSDAGLTLLAGGVLLKPRIDLITSQAETMGSAPLGPVPLTLTANIDYAPARWGPWAASLQWKRLSPRYATSDDRERLPALATLDVALRYQWRGRISSWTLRLDAFNLTNAQGLHISELNFVLPEQGRRIALTFAFDA